MSSIGTYLFSGTSEHNDSPKGAHSLRAQTRTPSHEVSRFELDPGVLFKAVMLLVKDYMHTRQINPNPTVTNPTQPIRLEL